MLTRRYDPFVGALRLHNDFFGPLNKLWFKFGLLLGKIVSPVVMGLIFFGIFTQNRTILHPPMIRISIPSFQSLSIKERLLGTQGTEKGNKHEQSKSERSFKYIGHPSLMCPEVDTTQGKVDLVPYLFSNSVFLS